MKAITIGEIYLDPDEGKSCVSIAPVSDKREAKAAFRKLFGLFYLFLIDVGQFGEGSMYVLAKGSIFRLKYDYAYGEAQLFGPPRKLLMLKARHDRTNE
jgi:hypothetical protein